MQIPKPHNCLYTSKPAISQLIGAVTGEGTGQAGRTRLPATFCTLSEILTALFCWAASLRPDLVLGGAALAERPLDKPLQADNIITHAHATGSPIATAACAQCKIMASTPLHLLTIVLHELAGSPAATVAGS